MRKITEVDLTLSLTHTHPNNKIIVVGVVVVIIISLIKGGRPVEYQNICEYLKS